ncbi:transcriptional activator spt7 [Metarhizium acridum CQMa 102]|uniref:Transcriptional activator spt7 n=1 Tax=Metarhizium acridum (strain CQMa 102) TaxID=655827 RepID=E9E429_METAQ|nr:transcriptional activator spt7 [Metarhizium acridum CQMa 102]EFY89246.1 transcriptional activator spt7 [Metarhizium acridum CQMa 102]
MSISNGQPAWPPPVLHHANSSRSLNHLDDGTARTQTPVDNTAELVPEAPVDVEEESRRALFADLYRKTEDKIALLFSDDGSYNLDAIAGLKRRAPTPTVTLPPITDHEPIKEPPYKKARRTIDEDDYDDDEEDEDEVATAPAPALKAQGSAASIAANSLLSPSKSGSSPVHSLNSPGRLGDKLKSSRDDSQSRSKAGESDDNAIKNLEEARLATEEAARRSFHTIIYTLENDRTAMLEQQRLEDSEKQLQAEMDSNQANGAGGAQASNQGSLSSANLGASSLTLKHLIARIDMKRDQVRASDAELRLLMNEVRKNRSKWASEENVNQEELYEAFEKVLTELKAHTEYSHPFLQRVNKRDAPDYYSLIKNPMDLGSMTKKLKSLTYKSKMDFVADLNLIWDNCLKYNQDMNSPLRRMANGMRKEAEKLIPLIPDLAVRSRAEVEAEERRKQNGGDDDGGDDSDDEPIMSSRGRKATTKGAKSRTGPTDQKEDTPVVDQKPVLQLNGLLGKAGREGSEVDGSNGFSTPPIAGSITPSGALNGHSGIASNADAMDIDGPSLSTMALNQAFGEAAEQAYEDEEYKIWKQTTKKDRALTVKERHFLFKENSLNVDAPALLRNRAGMRWFLKHQREAETMGIAAHPHLASAAGTGKDLAPSKQPETLAEGIDEETEQVMPDYYNPLTNIPDIKPNLQWVEDGEGQVINQHEAFLRLVPPGSFVAPKSRLTKKMDDNIRQIQETRKLATKISVIKQMQVQSQVYTNQFPKSNTETFLEQDIEPHFISDDGPVMASETCQDALKRSVAKILYHTGFEELQPSAIDTLTGIAADYFQKLVRTFNIYREAEKTSVQTPQGPQTQPRFTPEEVVLHTLEESGHDVASLESYAKDEVDRLSSRLGILHERMKLHLTDLLRPALSADAGVDGVGAFKDGSDQFMSGDFADDLGEDFFGFKALGLDKEMGLDSFSVPFHLLHSRVRNQYQMQTQTAGAISADMFEALPPSEPVTNEGIQEEIGLVKNFFLAKLHANGDQPLVEDEDLPVKQRKPRPRLGASGKIISAQKRPPREQLALAKKKKKMELAAAAAEAKANASPEKGANAGTGSTNTTPAKKKSITITPVPPPNPALLALTASMERTDSMQSQAGTSQTEKDENIAMMSPDSIAQ